MPIHSSRNFTNHVKDLGLATESAERYNAPLILGKIAQETYREAMQIDPKLARKDFSSIYKLIEHLSNTYRQ